MFFSCHKQILNLPLRFFSFSNRLRTRMYFIPAHYLKQTKRCYKLNVMIEKCSAGSWEWSSCIYQGVSFPAMKSPQMCFTCWKDPLSSLSRVIKTRQAGNKQLKGSSVDYKAVSGHGMPGNDGRETALRLESVWFRLLCWTGLGDAELTCATIIR